jgi:1,4-dihydroxy-2-naphthoate octaprenyltransferase
MRYWLLASRPKTLSLSITPVLTGNALAHGQGFKINLAVLAATLLAALAIQIGTNLHNDAADFEKGADTPDRVGPDRAAAQGWLTVRQIKQGAVIAFGFAFLLGIYLASVGGWPIVAVGVASLLAGWGYTAGPKPIAYRAWGELFVFLFFGLFAVAGSHYLQAGETGIMAWILGSVLGLPAAAVLLINNYRDMETDRQAGKMTLAARSGRAAMRRFYTLLLLTPYLAALLLLMAGQYWIMPVLLTLPLAFYLSKRLHGITHGDDLNRLLARTAILQTFYGICLVTGLLILF